jgi:predicted MPP superfamily phosphohydrolase
VREYLSQFCAPCGVYAVTGSPPVDLPGVIPPLFEGLAVRLLKDEATRVCGPDGQVLTLIGIECHHDIARDAANLDGVLSAAPLEGPRVLLYHSPELMPQAVEHGIDLYLCGHTHGGQVRLPVVGPVLTSSKLGRRYVMGHYHEGQTHLYVSRGVGFEGLGAPRVRLFCPPEITLITLGADEPDG